MFSDVNEFSDTSEEYFAFMRKSKILAQFLDEIEEDEALQAFIKHNDVGLPLARFITAGLATPLPQAYRYVNETYAMFIDAMEVSEIDASGANDFNDLMVIVEQKKNERDAEIK
jgi:hypothetical protein